MRTPQGDSQAKILAFIKSEVQSRGFPPSVREICEAVGLKSTSTVHGHLLRLQKKGLLHRDSMKPRAIEVLKDPAFNRSATISLPVVGKVAAGNPITAIEEAENFLMVPTEFVGNGEHFVLTIQGSSMIQAGIHDGDYVVVRKQSSAENGQIVVAMVDDDATVKRLYRENGRFRLQPENDAMDPIVVDDCEVVGKVVALLRKM